MILEYDNWISGKHQVDIVKNPSLDDVKSIFDLLDGQKCDTLQLQFSDEIFLGVGGGRNNRCILMIVKGRTTSKLDDPSFIDDEVMTITMGGQESDFPANQVVRKGLAWAAVQEFFQSQTISEKLHWKTEIY